MRAELAKRARGINFSSSPPEHHHGGASGRNTYAEPSNILSIAISLHFAPEPV